MLYDCSHHWMVTILFIGIICPVFFQSKLNALFTKTSCWLQLIVRYSPTMGLRSKLGFIIVIEVSIPDKDERPHQCPICSATFRSSQKLDDHKRRSHNKQKLKCTWIGCNAEFNSFSTRLYHIKKYHDTTPYHCDECNRKYELKRDLDHHKRKHQIMKTRKLQQK